MTNKQGPLACTLVVLLLAAGVLVTLRQPVVHNLTMVSAARILFAPGPVSEHEARLAVTRLQSISGEGSADYALGLIYLQRSDIAAAVEAFRRSRNPAPCNIAQSLRVRANQWVIQDRLAEAESAYRAALDVCPDGIRDRLALARVLNARGAVDEACDVLAVAAALTPESDAIHFEALGQMYLWRHQWPQALAAYRQAVALQPDRADYSATLAYTIYEVQGRASALRYLAGAARDERDWMWGLSLYATLLFAEGRCEEGYAADAACGGSGAAATERSSPLGSRCEVRCRSFRHGKRKMT